MIPSLAESPPTLEISNLGGLAFAGCTCIESIGCLSSEQQQLLQQYYAANQLLIDCLNTSCAVTAAVRQEIEATLLLPQTELEDREWQWG